MHDEIASWRNSVILWCLGFGPKTAAEITEQFAAVCQADEVDPQLWRKVDPSAMLGFLRKLESAGQVIRDGEKRDSRAGRTSPVWRIAGAVPTPTRFPSPPMPALDNSARAARAAPATSSTGLNPAPIRMGFGRACDPVGDAEEASDYEILRSGFDELAGIVARHQRELEAYVARQRVRFGLDEAAG